MKAREAESRICHPFQRLPCFLLWVQSVTREPPLIRRAVKASPRPSMAQSEEMMPAEWGFDSWAAWRAGTPGILGHPGSWRQMPLHIYHLQLLAGGDPEASGSSGNVMVTDWEGSHLHFLRDWLPVGEKPEPHASAKWFLHRTPLSCTVPSFNLPNRIMITFPPRGWLCSPPRSSFTGSRPGSWSVCSACLLATTHCLLNP